MFQFFKKNYVNIIIIINQVNRGSSNVFSQMEVIVVFLQTDKDCKLIAKLRTSSLEGNCCFMQ